jgi:polysaccharide pyruvyl transferase WcaK-like protein
MKKVVVIGAFDRYNYGDNLMPILFELFLKRFYPGFFNEYQLVFSALTSSDLSRYKAKKTVSIGEIFKNEFHDIHSIISIGGEVLSASSSGLFLHMNPPENLAKKVMFLRSNGLAFFADMLCRKFYDLPWEYPYIPKKTSVNTRIAFNTVGGHVSNRSLSSFIHRVRERLTEADYLSVRDNRTRASLQNYCSPEVFPDSAIVMADFISDNFMRANSRTNVNELQGTEYICFQAAPQKVGSSVEDCVRTLQALSYKYNLKVVLCPVGYASGHDDYSFLEQVYEKSGRNFSILYELNLWEIMSVIRNSRIFMGTSLHGIITALSFGVPYMGINSKVKKLDKFLKDWGLEPSTGCYSISEVLGAFETILNMDKQKLFSNSRKLIELGLENNHGMVKKLGIGG